MLRHLLFALFLALTACGPGAGMTRNGTTTDPAEALLGVLVTPEDVVVPQGGTVQLKATGLYAGRETRDLTNVVKWVSADPSVADLEGALDSEGRFAGLSVGDTTITASLDGVSSPPAHLRVTDQTISKLVVEPGELVLETDQEVQLQATATFSDGSRSDATGLVRWITDDANVATVVDGLVTGAGTGTTSLRAQYEAIVSDDVSVEVLTEATPDLRVATLSASPYAGRINVIVEVENIGNGGASAFWVDAFLDFPGTPGPGDYGDAYERVQWLGPGDTTQVVLELDVDPGFYEVTVSIDTEDEIDESNESNNHTDTTVQVSGGGGGGTGTTSTTSTTTTTTTLPADLSVDRVDFISDGVSVYYEVEISNYGDVGAGPFYVDLFVDRFSAPPPNTDGDDWQEVAFLAAWGTVTLEFFVDADCDYGCWSWVYVDSYQDVVEADESDNVYGPIDVY